MRKKILLVLGVFLLLNGCTRDDICAPEQAVTPLLIITFNNSLNREERKPVTNLIVTSDFDDETVIPNVSADSIAIPLRTTADNTRYRFTSTNNITNIEITDVFDFTYTRENVYINRACAFKTIYNEVDAVEDTENDTNDNATWILDIQINEQNIENELQSHITIFH